MRHQATIREFPRMGKAALGALLLGCAWMAHSAAARASDPEPLLRLHDACRRSDVQEALAILATGGVHVNAPDPESKRTALHWAVIGRTSQKEARLKLVTALLDHGADVHALTKAQESVIEIAVSPGWDQPLLELLLARGAKIDGHTVSPGLHGHAGPPLHRAVTLGDVGLARFLLDRGADIGVRNHVNSDTALMRVFGENPGFPQWRNFSSEKLRDAAYAMMSLLLERKADVHATNAREETALHWAAGTNHLACVRELVSRGARADVRAKDGRTVLHFAAGNSLFHDRAVFEALITNSRFPVDVTDQAGNTPLHRAVRASSHRAVESLLLLGANPALLNGEKKRPIDMEGFNMLEPGTREMLRKYTPPQEPAAPADSPRSTPAPQPVTALR